MRTLALILSTALANALVGCGLFNDDNEPPVSHADITTVAPVTSAGRGRAPVVSKALAAVIERASVEGDVQGALLVGYDARTDA